MMSNGKFGKFIIVGALTGAIVSMFDRGTRNQVVKKSNDLISEMKFYSRNPTCSNGSWRTRKRSISQSSSSYQAMCHTLKKGRGVKNTHSASERSRHGHKGCIC